MACGKERAREVRGRVKQRQAKEGGREGEGDDDAADLEERDEVFPGFLLSRDRHRILQVIDDGIGRGYVFFEGLCEEFGGGTGHWKRKGEEGGRSARVDSLLNEQERRSP